MMSGKRAALLITIALLLLTPATAFAGEGFSTFTNVIISCDQGVFDTEIIGGTAPYTFHMDFGDGEFYDGIVTTQHITLTHLYAAPGIYSWSLTVLDNQNDLVEEQSTVYLNGPELSLSSEPFPPLAATTNGEATLYYIADVTSGTLPYHFDWDLDGDGAFELTTDTGLAMQTYTTTGDILVSVRAIDFCGFTSTESLLVRIVPPGEHPNQQCPDAAQNIASVLNLLGGNPDGSDYTCEDVQHALGGQGDGDTFITNTLSRLQWIHAVEDLAWEDVLEWKIDLINMDRLILFNRYIGALEDVGFREVVSLIASADYTIADVHNAIQAVVRFNVPFQDVLPLARSAANRAELNQILRARPAFGLDLPTLTHLVEQGFTYTDLLYAHQLAMRTESSILEILAARAEGHSWETIAQTYHLTTGNPAIADTVPMGVASLRDELLDQDEQDHQEERDLAAAEQLADQFGVSIEEITLLLEMCNQDWQCVNDMLLDEDEDEEGDDDDEVIPDEDLATAEHLASQYSVSLDEVWEYYYACGEDWQCARATLRELAADIRISELDQATAEHLVSQFDVSIDIVWSFFESCAGDWSCVRVALRDLDTSEDATSTPTPTPTPEPPNEQDQRTAEQLARQYDVSLDVVWSFFDPCEGDWSCVRVELRELTD